MRDGFYKAFEEKYRGARHTIALRLRAYLPFVEPLAQFEKGAHIIDLGCGRGEWLELMDEIGFSAYGVDLDAGMLEDCYERGFSVEQGDAVAYLATLPDDSQAIVSAFHVVEHISFDQLHTVVSEAHRVLKPGGLLIMETPNPENITVATQNFYLDPTHKRPIPPQLLSFLPEYYGYVRTKILRLQESNGLTKSEPLTLNDVLAGPSPDYAVIAQKEASAVTLELFDKVFDQEYGLSLNTITMRYDAAIAAKVWHVETRARQAEAIAHEAHAKAQQAETQAGQAKAMAQQAETWAWQAEAKAQEAETRAGQAEVKGQEALARVQQYEIRAGQAESKAHEAHAMAQQAETRAGQAEAALALIYSSRSWRITAPLRWVGNVARWIERGSIAWLTFAPGSRPRRILRRALIFIKFRVSGRPLLKAIATRLLSPFPHLNARLRLIGIPHLTDCFRIFNSTEDGVEGIENLSPRARKIYFDLKVAIEQHKKEQP